MGAFLTMMDAFLAVKRNKCVGGVAAGVDVSVFIVSSLTPSSALLPAAASSPLAGLKRLAACAPGSAAAPAPSAGITPSSRGRFSPCIVASLRFWRSPSKQHTREEQCKKHTLSNIPTEVKGEIFW